MTKSSGLVLKAVIVFMAISLTALVAFGVGLAIGTQAEASPIGSLLPGRDATVVPGDQRGIGASGTVTRSDPLTTSDTLNVELFNEAWRLLQDQYYGDLPGGSDITYEAIQGVVNSLGDPHTAFVDPQQAEYLNADMEGHFEGIGARVATAEGGGVLITYLFAEQPAQKAGLQVGDIVVAVDSQDVTAMSVDEAIALIRGPEGSVVVLKVKREDQPLFDLTVTRARIEIPVVETRTLEADRIAYIALSEFSSVAPSRLAEALRSAVRSKPEGLILDLRGNPGGLLDSAVRIGSYFVSDGNILIERFKNGDEHVYPREGSYLIGKVPLVVLVDAGSASASEIVAGAIQDTGRGVLIGEKTYGKGSVQLPNSLSDGSQLRITIAHWFTPNDRGIDGAGLIPDIEVVLMEEDARAGRDPQLDRAVEYLLVQSEEGK